MRLRELGIGTHRVQRLGLDVIVYLGDGQVAHSGVERERSRLLALTIRELVIPHLRCLFNFRCTLILLIFLKDMTIPGTIIHSHFLPLRVHMFISELLQGTTPHRFIYHFLSFFLIFNLLCRLLAKLGAADFLINTVHCAISLFFQLGRSRLEERYQSLFGVGYCAVLAVAGFGEGSGNR